MLEERKVKRLMSMYGDLHCCMTGTRIGSRDIEEKELYKTQYEDVETGKKIIIHKSEIKGKITWNNLDKIAREKIEKEILRDKGLYEEIIVNIDETLETLSNPEETYIEENLVFTFEDIENFRNEINKHNELLEKYSDIKLSELEYYDEYYDDECDEPYFYKDEFDFTEDCKNFLTFYSRYKYILDNKDFFEEKEVENYSLKENINFSNESYESEELKEKREKIKLLKESLTRDRETIINEMQIENFKNDFYIDIDELIETKNLTKLEKNEQIKIRVNDCKPIVDIVFKYLVELKNRVIGVRKTEEEMIEKYGEFDEFFMKRRKD